MRLRTGNAAPNLARAASLMDECGIDALVVCSPVNVRWMTGFGNWLGPAFREYMARPGGSDELAQRTFAFLPRGGDPVLVVEPSFALDASDAAVEGVRVAGGAAFAPGDTARSRAVPEDDPGRALLLADDWADDPVSAVIALLKERGLDRARIGVEAGSLLAHERERLASVLPGASLLDCETLLRLIRVVKSAREIELLARATQIAEDAATRVAESASESTTPTELVDRFRTLAAQHGADLDHLALSLDGLGFVTGGNRVLRGATSMFYDYGCVYRGWISDAGTTLCLGEPGPTELMEHAAVRSAVTAGAEALSPGVRGSSVQLTMQASLAEAGIVDTFPHGHGVGLEVREYPILVAAEGRTIRDDCIELEADLRLEHDMVVNLEATILVLGERSVHCERTFVVTSDGFRPLTEQYRDAPLLAGARSERQAFA
jgi:Xaa-Pro aminopeptidase